MATPLPLDRITALALDPGANAVVRGVVTTSVDGSSFDATTQYSRSRRADPNENEGASRPGGLFDLPAGGLRVAEQHAERHEYVLAASGVGPACAAIGVPSPCLVPRVGALAHERLRTQAEFAPTLTGGVELDSAVGSGAAALRGTATSTYLAAVLVSAAVVGLGLLTVLWLRRRAQSALGRIRAAGREALRATRDDATLDRVRAEVRAMMSRSVELDRARRACARRLARIDRGALERKVDAFARSNTPDAADTLAWLTAEQAEAERLESDLSSSVAGLQRIESALRVVALRVREHRDTHARIARRDPRHRSDPLSSSVRDPVDAAAAELRLRDEATEEAERAVGV
jgi:hypothetical protein